MHAVPVPKEVQPLLEDSAEELFEHAPAGYLSTLADGTIVKVNATFLEWTGYARARLVGTRFQDLFTVPGRIYYETHLGPLLAMQGTLNEIAIDIACAEGRVLPALLNAAQKRNAAGECLVTRYTVFNATDRRRYEKELLHARRQAEAAAAAKTELLAMLSHDIRTPLGSIMAVAQILQGTTLSPEQERMVRILGSSSAAILALVNQILEHSKVEAGAVALHEQRFHLVALVRELVDNLRPLAHTRGITLDCELDERLPDEVVGDAGKLGQVLGNLVGNALKFTETGSVKVQVYVREISEAALHATVRVVDTGIGIAEDQIPAIFGEFRQAHPGIGARYGGSGLGLAISRKLLVALGSELKVASQPGKGSTFWFDVRFELPRRLQVPGSSRST